MPDTQQARLSLPENARLPLRGLSLTQPWASLVAVGAKSVETRSWKTDFRGLVAIHASKAFPPDEQSLVCAFGLRFPDALKVNRETGPTRNHYSFPDWIPGGTQYLAPEWLPKGAILAVAELYDCVPTVPLVNRLSEQERAFGNYAAGRYGFLLRNVLPLPKPIPCRGALSLWQIPADVLTQIEAVCPQIGTGFDV